MTTFRNAVFLAAIAGLVAGMAMAAMQAVFTVPLILKAEAYESAGAPAPGHHGDDEAAAGIPAGGEAPAVHDDGGGWAPADGMERMLATTAANIVTAIGFALVLVAISEFAGGITGWREGIFWGLAGFAVFTLAPGLGMPPGLPGMPAADLFARQAWWLGTVAGTAAGLALIVFGRSPAFAIAGLALIIAPHVYGAPQPPSLETAVPEDLRRGFTVAATLTNLAFWTLLGATTGALRRRLHGNEAATLRGSLA